MLKQHVRKSRPRARTAAGARAAAPAGVARVGRVEAIDETGTPWVTAPGWLEQPARALLASPPPGGAIELSAGRRVVLLPIEGDEAGAVIVGWLAEPAAPALERRIEVDGRRIVISAEQELELRCGEARITLTADGKVKIQGKGILNHARELNRIRGGQVRIN
jgi:hypothetical protein